MIFHIYVDDCRNPDQHRHPTCDFGDNQIWKTPGIDVIVKTPVMALETIKILLAGPDLLIKPEIDITLSLDHDMECKEDGTWLINHLEEMYNGGWPFDKIKAVTIHTGNPYAKQLMKTVAAKWFN